jgi:hypothetical protein
MIWVEDRLKERISEIASKFVNERIDTHSFDYLFKEIYRGTGISIKIGKNADIVWNGEHSVYITSRALQHRESNSVFKIHFVGKEFKRYSMILPRMNNLIKLNELQEEEEKMETGKKHVENALKSLSKYYTGKDNSLDNANEMFKGLISVYGLVVPADDILICKSLTIPAVLIQGKGKVSLIELHECERGLITTVAYNAELVYKFLKQYKTKEETKMEEITWVEINEEKQYVAFTEIIGKMKEGDIIKRPEHVATGIIKVDGEYRYYDLQTKQYGHVVALDDKVVNAKYEYIPAPQYVGWREAFEVYENGGTIECEYGGEMVWFNRNITSLEESSMLADKQLDGLLDTKWIIKRINDAK